MRAKENATALSVRANFGNIPVPPLLLAEVLVFSYNKSMPGIDRGAWKQIEFRLNGLNASLFK